MGAVLGMSAPLVLGVYGIQQHYAYIASLPPGGVACGNGAFGPLALIFVVGPFFGAIGGGWGWMASRIVPRSGG